MKLTLKKGALRILTDHEVARVAGGDDTIDTDYTCPHPTGTECGATYVPECTYATNNGTCIDCTNTCPTYDCHTDGCGGGGGGGGTMTVGCGATFGCTLDTF